MTLTTRFTELAGCRVPIQQAPMGPVSASSLAVAVADAGGVGSITAMGMTAAELDTAPKGHGIPPGAAATGHVEAMAMYAGESAALVPVVEPVAQVIKTWCAAGQLG